MNPQKHTMTVLAQIASWIPDKSVIECCDTPREHHRDAIRGSPETAY